MSDTMIERAEKAFCEAIGKDYDAYQGYYTRGVRAVIEAMRNPVGLTCMHDVTLSLKPSQTCLCHTAFNLLIVAALSEPGSPAVKPSPAKP